MRRVRFVCNGVYGARINLSDKVAKYMFDYKIMPLFVSCINEADTLTKVKKVKARVNLIACRRYETLKNLRLLSLKACQLKQFI